MSGIGSVYVGLCLIRRSSAVLLHQLPACCSAFVPRLLQSSQAALSIAAIAAIRMFVGQLYSAGSSVLLAMNAHSGWQRSYNSDPSASQLCSLLTEPCDNLVADDDRACPVLVQVFVCSRYPKSVVSFHAAVADFDPHMPAVCLYHRLTLFWL